MEANSRKTILNVLGTFFAILDYARECRIRAPETTLSALTITAERAEVETPYFKPNDAARIIAGAKEPCRTILRTCLGHRATRR